MPVMTATIQDVESDFTKYIASMRDGYEIIVTENGAEIGKFVPKTKSASNNAYENLQKYRREGSVDIDYDKLLTEELMARYESLY